MNLEQFPEEIKKDIENQSLEILESIVDSVIVIGGWAVRAHLGRKHHRYTLDVDGVADEKSLPSIKKRLKELNLEQSEADWGIKFFKQYQPSVEVSGEWKDRLEEIELRIEISGPRIRERRSHHYFEFSLTDFRKKEIEFHDMQKAVEIMVPPVEHMAAVKLGLPADYKNNFDSAALLRVSDMDEVIRVIKENDDWSEMVLRRMPKFIGRIGQPGSLENILAIDAGIDVKKHVRKLRYIEEQLSV